ncbi:glycosyltransferase family 2 protein [Flavobacterium granuli]|uniref:GT2 family glycosyltransferase n=1 Tax=Flavobacterium granuli TaxID=280093 RepID=A0A1M5QKC3_9FLAO|nr:glycosyltransferase family 2 protein [Flavobacterium granuli]PRZ20082.1 GT2 family glycosyltransferase [Flavobacterium granuli]SHH14458.1 Glycosyltransferase, GT2 family [Flavobacterium granuli]
MQDEKNKILTIIVTYNGLKWINKCIDSIRLSSLQADIYVVDNGSKDDTVIALKKYTDIFIYESKTNLGFGQANNIGMQYALNNGYDYVFLLNQDAWIEEDTLAFLMKVSLSNKEYGILSPLHYYSDRKSLEYNFSLQLSPWFCKNIVSDYIAKDKSEMKDVYPLHFINAAAWLISRKALETVGGFDPLFFHYGEDNNYCHRVNFHNMKVGIVPSVKIYHDCEDANNKRIKDSDEQLRKFELNTKTSYADINLDVRKGEILALAIKKLLFSVLFVFRFKFSEARNYWLSARVVFKNCNKIIESRKRNFIPRANYLINESKS